MENKLKEKKVFFEQEKWESERKRRLNERTEKYTFTIPAWAINYIENGNTTGLNSKEIRQVDGFIKDIVDNYGVGYWSWDDENYSSRNDDINHLGGEVNEVRYVVIHKIKKMDMKVWKDSSDEFPKGEKGTSFTNKRGDIISQIESNKKWKVYVGDRRASLDMQEFDTKEDALMAYNRSILKIKRR